MPNVVIPNVVMVNVGVPGQFRMFPSSFDDLKFLKEEPKSHSYGIEERESKKETERASNGSKNVASIKLKNI